MKRRALLHLALAMPWAAWAQAQPGWFGLEVSVEVDGSGLSPTLRGARIMKVVPQSPADTAGLRAGDVVHALDGRSVAGLNARTAAGLMRKSVGETLRVTVRREADALMDVTLVAAARPRTGD